MVAVADVATDVANVADVAVADVAVADVAMDVDVAAVVAVG